MSQITTAQITLSTSPQPLASISDKAYSDITITAFTSNAANAFWGAAGVTISTGDLLPPGAAVAVGVADPSTVYVVGTAADKVSWSGITKP